MQQTDPTNHVFQLAVRFVNQTDRHLFLTGKAGTGKTTFLRFIRENCFKRMIVVAPTGVAAINAGGVTIHSFFQLPFGPFVANHKSGWNHDQPVTNKHTLLKNIRFTAEKKKLIQELETLIIDEVSMMRCDMLDAIDHVLRHIRKKPYDPFGGVQMIYIGDLHQLPPVIKNEEWEILKDHYASPFFFDAHSIQQSVPVYIELKKIYRQTEGDFISILNNIRNNKMLPSDLDVLHQYYKPGFIPEEKDNYITLTSHNAKAEQINNRELEKIEALSICFKGIITGDFNDKALPAEINLYLKQGAQIMFLKNDKGEKRRYFNGKIGIVSKINEEQVFVKFPGREDEMEIEKETWRNIRYHLNEETNKVEEEEIGTYVQYPIRLAWAITIHKSQGLTFDKAIIDAGASFAAGQVYVALSRLTSLNGLILYSRIRPESISTDNRVLNFTQNEKSEQDLLKIIEEEQLLFTHRMLLQSFEWTKLTGAIQTLIAGYTKKTIPEKEEAVKWASEIYKKVRSQEETSRKFSKQLRQILLEISGSDHTHLRTRIDAAQSYFDEQLTQTQALVHAHIEKYSIKKKSKKYLTALKGLSNIFSRKRKELRNAVDMAQYLGASREKGRALAPNPGSQHTVQNLPLPLHEELPHQ